MQRIAKKLGAPKGIALALFIALVVIAIAQISWWILFQITISREQERLYLESARTAANLTVATLNQSYDRLVTYAGILAAGADSASVRQSFDLLLKDPAVGGYALFDPSGHLLAQAGAPDSSLFVAVRSHFLATLFLDTRHPIEQIKALAPDLIFNDPGKRGEYTSPWFAADRFTLNPEVLARVKNKAFHRIVMFASEGSFFVLLTLLGAFMIYRTLHQSEELKKQQENFIHAVTHEFKIPVASIKLYLETMSSPKIDKDKCLSMVPRMLEDCHRLERLVDNVLEAGRLAGHSRHLKLAPANLSADLQDYLEELRPLIERSHVKLIADIDPDISVKSDYQALRRVVGALVDNAIKYSPENRRELTVTARRVGKTCVLSFRDRGVGIEPQELRRIFDRFYRTGMESTRTVKGTGLGLFLVREIVAEHEGTVEVRSDGPDQGSAFIITLPLEKQA
jgi:two-component system, OmpR family, sensor histidine kinase CiaH